MQFPLQKDFYTLDFDTYEASQTAFHSSYGFGV